MVDERGDFLSKAREALIGAGIDLAGGRYNNAANRAYYACFFAAIAALMDAGFRPHGRDGTWGHERVQAEFAGTLIRRRKMYPAELKNVLPENLDARLRADYDPRSVTEKEAKRVLERARSFVRMVDAKVGGRA